MTSTALALSEVSDVPRLESESEPITLGALLREVLAEIQADCRAPDLPYRSR